MDYSTADGMAVPPQAVGLCGDRHNRIKECLTSRAYIDSVLVPKVLQFNYPAQKTLRIPAGQVRSLSPLLLLGRAAIFSQKQEEGF